MRKLIHSYFLIFQISMFRSFSLKFRIVIYQRNTNCFLDALSGIQPFTCMQIQTNQSIFCWYCSYIIQSKGYFLFFFKTAFFVRVREKRIININSCVEKIKKKSQGFLKFWISKELKKNYEWKIKKKIFLNFREWTRKQQKYLLFYQNFIDSFYHR